MRMQKEEKIVAVLLLMALGSLAAAFWAFGPEECASDGNNVAKSDGGFSVEGLVAQMQPTKSGGNLIIRLDATPLPVFVSSDAGAEEVQEKVNLGDRVMIKGTVSSFKGSDEIVVDRAADVVLLK